MNKYARKVDWDGIRKALTEAVLKADYVRRHPYPENESRRLRDMTRLCDLLGVVLVMVRNEEADQ